LDRAAPVVRYHVAHRVAGRAAVGEDDPARILHQREEDLFVAGRRGVDHAVQALPQEPFYVAAGFGGAVLGVADDDRVVVVFGGLLHALGQLRVERVGDVADQQREQPGLPRHQGARDRRGPVPEPVDRLVYPGPGLFADVGVVADHARHGGHGDSRRARDAHARAGRRGPASHPRPPGYPSAPSRPRFWSLTRSSMSSATRAAESRYLSSSCSLGPLSPKQSLMPSRLTGTGHRSPSTSATAPPRPPRTLCSSTVMTRPVARAAATTAASSRGLMVGTCTTRAWMPRPARISAAW